MVSKCWCGGDLIPVNIQGYGICDTCRGYGVLSIPDNIQEMYTFDSYWHAREVGRGHPPIEKRPENDIKDGRVDTWLKLIDRFGPKHGICIEVGCGSGVLLGKLKDRYECHGIEPDGRTCVYVYDTQKVSMYCGMFPDVAHYPADLFLAFDVWEHLEDPLYALQIAKNFLNPDGTIIIQTPTLWGDYSVSDYKKFFIPDEHLWIFSIHGVEMMAERCGLAIVHKQRLWVGHEIYVMR